MNTEWISVKERLPELPALAEPSLPSRELMLIVDEASGQVLPAIFVQFNHIKAICWRDMAGDSIRPTHWMPLPTPPKEVRNEQF